MTSTLALIASVVTACATLAGCGKQSPNALIASAKRYLSQGDPKAASIQLKNAARRPSIEPPFRESVDSTTANFIKEAGRSPAAQRRRRGRQ